MPQNLLDTFTGTPGVNLTAYNPNWVMVSGTTGIFAISSTGDQAAGDAAGGTAVYVRTDVPPSADYSVTADLAIVGSVPSGPAAGVIGRGSTGASTHYEARFLSSGGNAGTWQLRRVINGSGTVMLSIAGAYVNGQIFSVKLHMLGDQISMYLDGALTLGPFTDASIADAGLPGIRGFNALGTRFRFDNLSVDTFEAAGAGVTAAIAWTEANDTSALSGALTNRASIVATEPADSAVVAARVTNRISLQWSEPNDAAILTGSVDVVAPTNITAAIAWTEPADSAAIAVRLTNRAALSMVEPVDNCQITGLAGIVPPLYASVRYLVLPIKRLPVIHLSQ